MNPNNPSSRRNQEGTVQAFLFPQLFRAVLGVLGTANKKR